MGAVWEGTRRNFANIFRQAHKAYPRTPYNSASQCLEMMRSEQKRLEVAGFIRLSLSLVSTVEAEHCGAAPVHDASPPLHPDMQRWEPYSPRIPELWRLLTHIAVSKSAEEDVMGLLRRTPGGHYDPGRLDVVHHTK
jgi:hypothetical protein